MRGKEDPFLKIGETNVRSSKGESEYVWALKDINLEVNQGEVLGIIGRNGAGKSTLLKILSKVTGPTTGRIDYNGRIGSLLEVGTGFHPELTGKENIFLNGAILGMTKAEINRKLDEIVDFAGVERYIDTPVKRYSSGMTVRLGFAVAAHLEPEILVVDEVLAVGDAEFQKKAIGKMQDVSRKQGRTVLFVSHNMESIRNLCKRGVLLSNGSVEKNGDIEDVVNDYIIDNLKSVGDCRKIDKMQDYRISATTKEIEITGLKRINEYSIDSCDSLEFLVYLKKNENIEKFQIMSLINEVSVGGTRVGMAYSEPIQCPIDENRFTVRFKILNHNLAKGKYILDIWAGVGDVRSSIKYYDAVYETITFEVKKIKDSFINEWHHYWGNNCYTNVSANLE